MINQNLIEEGGDKISQIIQRIRFTFFFQISPQAYPQAIQICVLIAIARKRPISERDDSKCWRFVNQLTDSQFHTSLFFSYSTDVCFAFH